MLIYKPNQDVIRIQETTNGNDIEFHIHIFGEEPFVERMKLVREKFDENQALTDVLFYVYPNHEYRVIVRQDYYNDFVLELMRHQFLQSVEWTA
ncbi:hypothetical protein [Brevibacillus nitrificans]|uniref:hypothetical protein n=1 Tax=Brevibacillus nitrificans TaxID=651560 RepID=UPI0028608E52|nr:hypothetical protein [Brevibacillus nitrificans]MDR7319274.1 hypothetical protein [Brevibacillus nitrificans]